MLEIKEVVGKILFDDEWEGMTQKYTEDNIEEALRKNDALPSIKNILPEDYKWYMKNYGNRTIDIRNRGFLTKYDESTYLVASIINMLEPIGIYRKYSYYTCTGYDVHRKEKITDEDDKLILELKYMPITDMSVIPGGGMILMDVKDSIGSIWRVPPKIDYINSNIDNLTPYFVADNFTEFLKLNENYLGSYTQAIGNEFKEVNKVGTSGIWKKND